MRGRPFIVAIDGPAGAGKSSTSRLLATRLGFAMVDTGAIYRTVALAATRAGIALDDDARLGVLLPAVVIRFAPRPGGGQRVLLGDEDVSEAIRTPPMSLGASAVSARPVVRAGLLELQRRLATAAENAGAVLEGRDIGTVVFPNAELKIYMRADVRERAVRRQKELKEKGVTVEIGTLEQEIAERDRIDSDRSVSPLRKADDAVELDTTSLTIDEQVDFIVERAQRIIAA